MTITRQFLVLKWLWCMLKLSNFYLYCISIQNPRINLLFSMRRVVELVLLFYTGLLPFIPIKESNLEIFLPAIYLR